MKRLRCLLYVIVGMAVCCQSMLVEAAVRARSHQSQAKKPVVQANRAASQKHQVGVSPKMKSRVVTKQSSTKTCTGRRRGGQKAVQRCNVAEPVLTSPIKQLDLDKPVGEAKDSDIKARVVPERAYAVDGETFFYQGRKYRVSGLSGGEGSEMAKQRLQKALDSGGIAVEALGVDDAGVTTAIVRTNGRNLADQITKP